MSAARTVNLDFAASTPLRPCALEAMRRYDASPIAGANPNALHSLGRAADRALDGARRSIAASLGRAARPGEVVFTSGGTEANHLALLGIAEAVRARTARRRAVVVSAIEHDSILDNARLLEQRGFEVHVAPCNARGIVTEEALEEVLGDDCALVSIMFANNETGVIQPVEALARRAHAHGPSSTPMRSRATSTIPSMSPRSASTPSRSPRTRWAVP